MRRGQAEFAWFVVILGLAAWLRLGALAAGVPYDLGSDEPHVMERAVRILKTGDFNPHFFDYPGFYIYLQAGVAAGQFLLGAMDGTWRSLDEVSAADFYILGRAVTAVFGILTVVLVWAVARRLHAVAGLMAALLLAVNPLHVRESHFVLTDVPMAFFVTLTLLCSVRAVEGGSLARWLVAGVAAGLAIGTKYTGAVALVMPMVAIAVASRGWQATATRALATAAGTGAAFLVVAPYTLLDLPGFLNGFAALAAAHANGPVPDVPAWWTYLRHVRINAGLAAALLALASLPVAAAAALVSARPADRVVWAAGLACAAATFWMISGQTLVFARYLLPLLPALSVLAGGTVALVWQRIEVLQGAPWPRQAAVGVALALVLALAPAMRAIAWVDGRNQPTTAALAYAWILDAVPAGSSLVIESTLSLPAKWSTRHVRFLGDHSRAYYDSLGVEYFVVSQDATRGARPRPYPDLLRGTELVREFTPGAGVTGAWIQIYRVVHD